MTNILLIGEDINEKFVDKLYNKLETYAVVSATTLKSKALKRYIKDTPSIVLTTTKAVREFMPNDFLTYIEKHKFLPVFFSKNNHDEAHSTYLAIEEVAPYAVSAVGITDDRVDELLDIVVGNM